MDPLAPHASTLPSSSSTPPESVEGENGSRFVQDDVVMTMEGESSHHCNDEHSPTSAAHEHVSRNAVRSFVDDSGTARSNGC